MTLRSLVDHHLCFLEKTAYFMTKHEARCFSSDGLLCIAGAMRDWCMAPAGNEECSLRLPAACS